MNRKISFVGVLISIFSILIVVSYLVYFVILDNRVEQLFFEQAYVENEEIADSAGDLLEEKINQEINTIIGIEVAHHNLLGQEGHTFDDDYYQTLMSNSEYIRRIEVLNLNKDIIYSTEELSNRVGINIDGYYLFDDLVDFHKLSIGNVVYTPNVDELTIEVAYSGEDCIITGLISIQFFREYGIQFKETFSEKEVMILNSQGKYIYDSYGNQQLIQNFYLDYDELIENVDMNEFSTFVINNEECIVNIEELGINDWIVVIYESTDSALSLNIITTNYYSIVLVSTFVASLVLIGFMFYYILRDYRVMIRNLNSITNGVFIEDTPDIFIRELSLLRSGFNKVKNKLKESTSKLEYLAFNDELTGLSTKNKAIIDFDKLKSSKKSITFIYMDIRRFEVFNENYGYEFGDSALQYVSSILSNYTDDLYRVQSDEFLGFIYDKSKEEIIDIISKFNLIISKGIERDSAIVPINLNMGISIYPNNGNEFDDLIKKAILVTREVKSSESTSLLFYDDAKTDRYLRRSNIELVIRNALKNNEFSLAYQPIVHGKDGKVRGFEALSRWTSPELGVVGPYEFIPILEKNNLISILDYQVIRKAMEFNQKLSLEYKTNYVACVNVSVDTIMRDDFVDFIDNLIDELEYDHKLLEIEITESTIIKDFDGITKKMKYLRDKGVRFSEDDFGDGYSSFSYLTKLEIDTLKISRGFLLNLLENKESIVLIQTIIELAKRLGFSTVIEGVEEVETLEMFRQYGCDYIQGYLFYKPMKDVDLIELIKNNNWKEY